MRIVHLIAGAGGMYCGGCLYGNTLANALREAGQDVVLVPVYTPLKTDEACVATARVAYGGVNVFLQQHSVFFRHAPRFLDRLFDRPWLLRLLGKYGGATRPEGLGRLTVSMLAGEDGRQRKELDKLIDFLAREIRPDLIHLSTAMLSGMARRITRELGVPVVCSLTGEDAFLEKVPEPYYSRARAVLSERCKDLAALVAMNEYYAALMSEYLAVPRERIHVIPPGINTSGYFATRPSSPSRYSEELPLRIGYLSRICPDKGLHLLAEAFKLLVEQKDLPPMRLTAAGYLAAADRPYLDRIRSRMQAWGLGDRFEYLGEIDLAAKIAFLESLDVMSIPAILPESKGLPVLEAWAGGVPVVLPDIGAYRELVNDTGGGLLCPANSAADLAEGLKRMIGDRAYAEECGRRGREAVENRYNLGLMARRTVALYGRSKMAGPGASASELGQPERCRRTRQDGLSRPYLRG